MRAELRLEREKESQVARLTAAVTQGPRRLTVVFVHRSSVFFFLDGGAGGGRWELFAIRSQTAVAGLFAVGR